MVKKLPCKGHRFSPRSMKTPHAWRNEARAPQVLSPRVATPEALTLAPLIPDSSHLAPGPLLCPHRALWVYGRARNPNSIWEGFPPTFQSKRSEVGSLGFRDIKGRIAERLGTASSRIKDQGSTSLLVAQRCPLVGEPAPASLAPLFPSSSFSLDTTTQDVSQMIQIQATEWKSTCIKIRVVGNDKRKPISGSNTT